MLNKLYVPLVGDGLWIRLFSNLDSLWAGNIEIGEWYALENCSSLVSVYQILRSNYSFFFAATVAGAPLLREPILPE